MGNVTVTIIDRGVRENCKYVVADIVMAASYAAGGDVITAANILKLLPEGEALSQLISWNIENRDGSGHSLELDRANAKVKAFNGTTEIVAATDLSTVEARLSAEYGRRTGSYESV